MGCDKNTIDSEHIIYILEKEGYVIVENETDADAIIINTCVFIEDAKKESIESIFDLVLCKKYGKCKKIIVAGCMAERYKENLISMMPEIDASIGVHNLENILPALKEGGVHIDKSVKTYREYTKRKYTGDGVSAFVRIADGCHSRCSFCAIPLIRGDYRSRKIEDIVFEVNDLAKLGVKEINLIAQETTYYGKDLYGDFMLPKLLFELTSTDISWIRVLYQNPSMITDEIINSVFTVNKIVPYFDIPMQHVNADILRDMNRKGDYASYMGLIDKIREHDVDAAVRSSFIVGFPGEETDEFDELVGFVEEAALDRVGIFIYSEEEGTKALKINKSKAEHEVAMERREKLMEAALDVSADRLKRFVGREIDVLVENVSEDGIIGRSKYDAKEVDGVVYIEKKDNTEIKAGDIIKVVVENSNEYDLFATL